MRRKVDNQKESPKTVIEYGKENLKDILSNILLEYVGEKKYAK